MTIGSLLIELGFKTDDKKLKDFIGMLGDLNLSSIMGAVGLGGLVEGMKKISEMSDRATDGMYAFGVETGMSSEKMKQLSNVAEQYGVSAKSVDSALRALQNQFQKGRISGFGEDFLTGLHLLNQAGAGISDLSQETPFTFIEKARTGLRGMSADSRSMVMGMLGLNTDLLRLLTLEDEKWNDIYNSTVPTEQNVRRIAEAQAEATKAAQEFNNIWVSMKSTGSQFVALLSKGLTPILRQFNKRQNDLNLPGFDTFNGLTMPWLAMSSQRSGVSTAPVISNTFNIRSTDPKEAAEEVRKAVIDTTGEALLRSEYGSL